MLPADSPFAALPAPGPHPGTAELRAYAAGTLPPADEHRIEAHTLDCERCAELLEGFSMSDAATTDQALAELRARLAARVADAPAVPMLLPASRPLWPRLAAAVALLGVAGGGIWGWQQYEPAPATTARVATVATAAAVVPQASVAAGAAKAAARATTAAAPEPTATAAAPASAEASATQVAAVARAAKPAQTAPVVAPAAAAIASNAKAARVAAAGRVAAADYAAVVPARRGHTQRTGPLVPAPATAPEQVALAPNAAPMAATQSAADNPVSLRPEAASAAPAPVLARVAARPPGRPAADTVLALGEVSVASAIRKAKAMPAGTAALVANTPMPAAVAIAPAPVTGTPALRDYLRREAAEFELEEGAKPLSGTVRLRFVVEADGQLSNLRVVRGLRADYDEEALRMVCEGPAWRPGIAGGRRAALPMEITVSF